MEYFHRLKKQVLTQTLPGRYKERLSYKSLFFYCFLGTVNLILGIILSNTYSQITEIEIPYNNNESQKFSFFVPKNISGTVLFYIKIEDFYQNHLFYAKSLNYNQLEGKNTSKISSCSPLERTDGTIIYPCGLIANTFLQDGYKLFKNNEEIPISTQDISWSSEKRKVGKTQYNLNQIVAPPLWTPYEEVPNLSVNYRFINWMNIASFSSFKKLYGKIDGLEKGEYEIIIDSTFPFGKKSVFISEPSWAGSKNFFISTLFMVTGSFIITISFLLIVRKFVRIIF
ncbi:cell cycle control protein 50 [Hamiltosporidium tvaerminnensis]|uniref:Cell cycle control protein 50 n=2 Tax=Hamiltosporidium TaxID=1176354 RepID=A0A4Q9LA01_9MICR|nr:alkylphosphocholine resistance protein lem3 [Hamiltosporidium tvaerminnensis]TBU00703.1 cell cycle control protein 50 [Hamiltosporidium magnivora]TBU02285.1 cell cycle control protein 50 [Hamiltosporidium tvaerminnensis]TBU04597.1 cell cycle control protein 50 [Hamiltosporidium magnivora]TBU13184.1 cell cycle control protein 50 [Hamiltosporidium tvaerminnensis]